MEVTIFKQWYEAYIFSLLPKFGLSWEQEIKQVNNLWEATGKLIDMNRFKKSFCSECNELGLIGDSFNFELAFENANTIWRSEIMTNVVNRIIIFWNDLIPINSKPAHWNGREMIIDNPFCEQLSLKRPIEEDDHSSAKRRHIET